MGKFAFHSELFEQRTRALEALADRGYTWLEHFGSVDLLHDLYGLEVCGIPKEPDSVAILALLQKLFPEWPHSAVHYHDRSRDRGWKVLIFKNRRRGKSYKRA
jgi:hypothetical protein